MTRYAVRGPVYVGDWRVVRPRFARTQEQGFEWLAAAHTFAAARRDPGLDEGAFLRRIRQALRRFGCSDGQIESRGHELEDFVHLNWERMQIFRLADGGSEQHNLERRMAFFAERCDEVMAGLYPEPSASSQGELPDLMIHVTCTGYNSPSPTQRIIALRGWQQQVQSFQAYHMGCYAAVPALRVAAAQLSAGMASRVDVIHNELCTLHFDPSAHEPEQLVVQSLFADGHIAYSLRQHGGPGALQLLAVGEEVIADSVNEMTWSLGAGGFRMTLGRHVPPIIAASVKGFVHRLLDAAGFAPHEALPRCLAALHPGGPRIIDGLREALGLSEEAVWASRSVLRDYGNMSSATLPHILARLATESQVPAGTPLVGLAFGPGLTMAGLVAVRA